MGSPDFVPPNGVPIRTLDDAMRLLDEWISAYDHNIRGYARHAHKVEMALFLAEHETAMWRNQADLYRSQIVRAGIAPMDFMEVNEPATPVEEACPFG